MTKTSGSESTQPMTKEKRQELRAQHRGFLHNNPSHGQEMDSHTILALLDELDRVEKEAEAQLRMDQSLIAGYMKERDALKAERDRMKEALEKRICEIQLSGANSNMRSDIKQGHWMACYAVRDALAKLGRSEDE